MALVLGDILDADDDVAVRALARFVGPVLRRRVSSLARKALPATCSCRGLRRHDRTSNRTTGDIQLCDSCQVYYDDLLLANYIRLRVVAAGPPAPPATEIRELRLLVDVFTDLDGPGGTDADDAAAMLQAYTGTGTDRRRRVPHSAAPAEAWLRAAWAQLVHYPTKHLAATMRREDAVRRDYTARPMRTLNDSPAAAALAADPPANEALRELVTGIWANVVDPHSLPTTARVFQLDSRQAAEALDRGVALLRHHDPATYESLVARPLAVAGHSQLPVRPNRRQPSADTGAGAWTAARSGVDPADLLVQTLDVPTPAAERARTTLAAELAADAADAAAASRGTASPARRRRSTAAQASSPRARLLRRMVDAADGSSSDLVAACQRLLRVNETTARDEVRRLGGLVAEAGVDWVENLLRDAEPPAAAGRPASAGT